MDESHKKAEESGGGEYLVQMRMALEHVEEARKYASYNTTWADRQIRAIKKHIAECEDES